MGFTFNGRHSDEFGIGFVTKTMPYIPQKRQTTIEVQGRDGQYAFEDGYNNITIELACAIAGSEILDRRKKAREISVWLANTGKLIFDYEKDVEYRVVKVINDVVGNILGREYKDEFTIVFECEPYQHQTFYNDNLTWENASIAWKYANIPWAGYPRTFTVIDGQSIDVVNAGTYKALPIIILTGEATTVTIGSFTYTSLSGTVYIDCKNQVVYSITNDVKTNMILHFSGDFLELAPGTNTFVISGTITNLEIEFDYKNTYL